MSEIDPPQWLKHFLLNIFRTWPFSCMKSAAAGLYPDPLTSNWAYLKIYDLSYIVGAQTGIAPVGRFFCAPTTSL